MRPHRWLRGDRGVTLVELSISMLILSIVSLATVAWMMAAGVSDRFQEEATASMDSLRAAKGAIVSELRFGDAVSSDPELTNSTMVTVWIDRVDAGAVGTPDTGVGEWVSWEITSDGRFVRTTDAPGDTPLEVARGLIVGESGSSFSYPAPGVVAIRLVADTRAAGAGPATVQTQVQLRNG